MVQKLLEERIHDDSEGVVVLAWKALRIVAQEEGYDQCMYMFRKNIVSRINDAIAKVCLQHTGTRRRRLKLTTW